VTPQVSIHLSTLQASEIQVLHADDPYLSWQGLVIDSIFRYGLRGDPHGGTETLIEKIAASGVSALWNDLPTGIEATSTSAIGRSRPTFTGGVSRSLAPQR